MRESAHVVVFELAGQKYALQLSAVLLVVRAGEITPLPKAPPCVAGIINFQGQVVPVFSLRQRFHLPERELQLADHIIFARTARRLVALVVDAVGGVVECAEGATVPVPVVLPGAEYVAGLHAFGVVFDGGIAHPDAGLGRAVSGELVDGKPLGCAGGHPARV